MLYYLIRCTLSYLSFTGKEDKGNTAKYCCPHCMKIKDQEVKLFLIGVIFSNKNKSKLQNTFKDMKDLFWAFFFFRFMFYIHFYIHVLKNVRTLEKVCAVFLLSANIFIYQCLFENNHQVSSTQKWL